MDVLDRIHAMSVTHPITMNRRIDLFLSENLPDFLDEYKIANRSLLGEIDPEFNDLDDRLDSLEQWKEEFSTRLERDQDRMDRLKVKYGVK